MSVRTGVKPPVQLAHASLVSYWSQVSPVPRYMRTNSHLPTVRAKPSPLSSLQEGFPHCPGSRAQEVQTEAAGSRCGGLGRGCHLAMALAACLVAVRVKAFADIAVAWAARGVSPPASGARLVNPAERSQGRRELPPPPQPGVAIRGPSDAGCRSARFSVL